MPRSCVDRRRAAGVGLASEAVPEQPMIELESSDVEISTTDGSMPAFLCKPRTGGPFPAVLVLMEAFGVTGHIRDVASRIAKEGYVTLVPDLYYRHLPNNTFGYDQVDTKSESIRTLTMASSVTSALPTTLAQRKTRGESFWGSSIGTCGELRNENAALVRAEGRTSGDGRRRAHPGAFRRPPTNACRGEGTWGYPVIAGPAADSTGDGPAPGVQWHMLDRGVQRSHQEERRHKACRPRRRVSVSAAVPPADWSPV